MGGLNLAAMPIIRSFDFPALYFDAGIADMFLARKTYLAAVVAFGYEPMLVVVADLVSPGDSVKLRLANGAGLTRFDMVGAWGATRGSHGLFAFRKVQIMLWFFTEYIIVIAGRAVEIRRELP